MLSVIRSRYFALLLTVALEVTALAVQSCVHAPANLSPAAVTAYDKTRVIKALDVLRDTAVDANAQNPPVLSTATTRLIVTFHEATLKTLDAAGSGWPATVKTAVDNFVKGLSPADQKVIQPYVTLIDTLLGSL